MSNATDVFKFATLRTVNSSKGESSPKIYINDDTILVMGKLCHRLFYRQPRDLSTDSTCETIKKIVLAVICKKDEKIDCKKIEDDILSQFEIKDLCIESSNRFIYANDECYFQKDSKHYFIPNKLEKIAFANLEVYKHLTDSRVDAISIFRQLAIAKSLIENCHKRFDKKCLLKCLAQNFGKPSLHEFVFDSQYSSKKFNDIKAVLFDLLYSIYLLRKICPRSVENIMEAIQVLHVIEHLAMDEMIENECCESFWAKAKKAFERVNPFINSPFTEKSVIKTHGLGIKPPVEEAPPKNSDTGKSDVAAHESAASREEKGHDKEITDLFKDAADIVLASNCIENPYRYKPAICSCEDLKDFLEALPLIPCYITRCPPNREPFNDLTPIGCCDLKVVKQWLVEYQPGEISHIHNIMKGEVKERNHKRFEKTEESFSFSSEQNEATERETQSTDRFEVKREAESTIKNDLNLKADASFTYNQAPIVASLSGGIASNNSTQNSEKTASNFARDVMSKAISRVESRAKQERSMTKIFETTEENKHSFKNDRGDTHVSGIYRWVDKKYKAQVFNYGKRLMYEFVLPEPAAFYVLSKIKGYEMFQINSPKKPEIKPYKNVVLGFRAEDIDYNKFTELQSLYDLSQFSYPIVDKKISYSNIATLKNEITSIGKADEWTNNSYVFDLNEKGYLITEIYLNGKHEFHGVGAWDNKQHEWNKLIMRCNGTIFWQIIDKSIEDKHLHIVNKTFSGLTIAALDGKVQLDIEFQDLKIYTYSLVFTLKLSDANLHAWQANIFNKIEKIESLKLKSINDQIDATFNSQMAEYRQKLAEFEAKVINDIIQGKSESYNRDIIKKELKRMCLAALTKAFDTPKEPTPNIPISDYDTMDKKDVEAAYWNIEVDENADPSVSLKREKISLEFPVIDLGKAKEKGRYVQFLEQAFEWNQIAYIFYPYFWAYEPKWIEMLNREDYTDPHMTAFLQAGSVKILLAVSPEYNAAVKWYLCTGEPWLGGKVPGLNDPMYKALYEEIRAQQDDLYNATPEGEAWEFTVPTSLVYLQDSASKLPKIR